MVSKLKSLNKTVGKLGEDVALKYLVQNHGFQIIERNYTFGKGEIDIIAIDGEYLVFVEVKARKSLKYGVPEEAITKSKIKQIKKIASGYLYEKKITSVLCRFDVVAIVMNKDGRNEINYYDNVFN